MYDLSKEQKNLQKLRVKAHLEMRNWSISEKDITVLAKIFHEIEDQAFFWVTLYMNKLPESPALMCYYNALQEWYHQYRLQEEKKDEWLCLWDMSWRKERIRWFDFYSDQLLIHRGKHLHQVQL